MIIQKKTLENMFVKGERVKQIQTKIDGTLQTVYNRPIHVEIPYCNTGSFAWADTGLKISPSVHAISTKSYVNDLNNVSTSNIYLYFGARTSYTPGATKANIMLRKQTTDTFVVRRDWGIPGSYASYDTEIINIHHEFNIDLNPEYTNINGVQKPTPAGEYTPTVSNLYIGAMGGDNSTPINGIYKAVSQRIYPYKVTVWATGEAILDVVPVRYITGEIRLYDKVREDYLPNIGTGPFLDPISNTGQYEPPRSIPAWAYSLGTPVYALRSDRGSAYIDTNYSPKIGKDTLVIKHRSLDTERAHMFSGWGTEGVAYEWWYPYTTSTVYYLNNNTNENRQSINLSTTRTRDWFLAKRDKYVIYYNNNFRGTIVNADFTTDSTVHLFARTKGANSYLGDIQYAYCIKEDGTYAFDLVPFVHNDGRVGMLDLVTREMFTNKSSNSLSRFVPVYDVNPSWVYDMGNPVYGLKSVNGAYINTLIPFKNTTVVDAKVMFTSSEGRIGGAEADIPDVGIRRIGMFAYNDEDRIRLYSYDTYSDRNMPNKNVIIKTTLGYYGRYLNDLPRITDIDALRTTSFTGPEMYCYGGTNLSSVSGPVTTEGLITYRFTIMDKYETVFDGIPFVHNDGRIGVLDLVTRNFFENLSTNAGSAFEIITEGGIAETVANMGIMPSHETDENINTLLEMGVRL